MVAGLEQREQGGRLGGDAAGERDAAGAALEVGHPFLEHRGRRVHDARVGVAVLLEVEVRRRRLRVLEHVAGRLEDRHRAGAGVGVGPLPGVQLPGLEAEVVVVVHARVGHGDSLPAARNSRTSGICRASSSRKQSWPYGASITCSSTGLPRARSAVSISCDADGRVEPVGAERDQQGPRRDAGQRRLQRTVAVLAGEVEVRQRARGVEVGVGVEALDERVGLVAQVALDLELRLGDRVADVVGELQPPGELVVQRHGRQVRHVADHPGHAHAGVGGLPGAVVVPALPRRVALDRLAGDRVPGQALRVQRVRAGDGHDRVDLVGVEHGPLEGLHPAERPAGHRGEPVDAEHVEERPLGAHHVGDGDHREVRAVRRPGRRVRRRRAGGPAAAAEQVGGDHEVVVGVEGLAGADHPVPPAQPLGGRAVAFLGPEPVAGALVGRPRRDAGRVRVPAERVADQDHVVALG